MTKRGPKTGKVQEGSLAAKMLNIKIGETIYLDDRNESGADAPTLMQRNVFTVQARSPALTGRKFATERFAAIQTGPLVAKPILAITRTE